MFDFWSNRGFVLSLRWFFALYHGIHHHHSPPWFGRRFVGKHFPSNFSKSEEVMGKTYHSHPFPVSKGELPPGIRNCDAWKTIFFLLEYFQGVLGSFRECICKGTLYLWENLDFAGGGGTMLMMSFVQNSNWRKPFFEGGGQSLWGGGKPHETWFVNFSVNFFEALKAASKMSVLYDAFFDIYEGIPKAMKTTDVSRDFGAEQFDSFVFFFVTSSYPIGSIPSLKLTTNAPWKWWKSQVRNLPLPGGPHFQGIIGRSEKWGSRGSKRPPPLSISWMEDVTFDFYGWMDEWKHISFSDLCGIFLSLEEVLLCFKCYFTLRYLVWLVYIVWWFCHGNL